MELIVQHSKIENSRLDFIKYVHDGTSLTLPNYLYFFFFLQGYPGISKGK